MLKRHALAARLLAGSLALGTVLCIAPGAMAQSGGSKNALTPPTPQPPRAPASHLGGMAMAIVLGLLVVGVNFMPSKRGHQD